MLHAELAVFQGSLQAPCPAALASPTQGPEDTGETGSLQHGLQLSEWQPGHGCKDGDNFQSRLEPRMVWKESVPVDVSTSCLSLPHPES